MGRQAVLVGNTASYSQGRPIATPAVMRRTIDRIAFTLAGFPDTYAFEVTTLIDKSAEEVSDALRVRARLAAQSNSLVLFYYFGHGMLSADQELLLVHSDGTVEKPSTVNLKSLELTIQVVEARKSIFIIDTCFSGARPQDIPYTLKGQQHVRLASATPASRAYLLSGDLYDPIGVFTRGIVDGLTSDVACVSPADNAITAQSLFNYAERETIKSTNSIQTPMLDGGLNEPLTIYQRKPQIKEGISPNANEKTAYRKMLAIIQTIRSSPRSTEGVPELHRQLIRDHGDAFMTLHKDFENNTFRYQPVQEVVIHRYVLFLRRLGIINKNKLALTQKGIGLLANDASLYNARLMEAVEKYLERYGLSLKILDDTLGQILASRRVPSRDEILDYLTLAGHDFHKQDVAAILDILGYSGAFRMSAGRAYFPW